jgi:SAM-dependent methyltransferase
MDQEKWNRYLNLMPKEMADRDRGTEDLSLPLGKGNLDYLSDCRVILDIGCGTGVAINELYNQGKDVSGITINEVEKKKAIEKYGEWIGGLIAIGDVHELPWASDLFDGVIMWEILEHTISPLIALWEANRVLKMGGKLVLMIPHECYIGIPDHTIVTNHAQTKALLNKAGFSVTSLWDMTGQSGRYWCEKIKEIK